MILLKSCEWRGIGDRTLVCEWDTPNEGGDAYCDLIIGGSDEPLRVEVQDLRGVLDGRKSALWLARIWPLRLRSLAHRQLGSFVQRSADFHAFVSDLEDSPETAVAVGELN